ncbi:hypothetical protein JXA88_04675 [Candidatus Fermentibacteria bacterium]|nr:hypothetical protein [Candidatus Fermentibacteria bacterium]
MRASLILVLIVAIAGSTEARRQGRLEIGLALRHWESSDASSLDISQTAAPLRLDLPLGDRFGLSLRANPGRSTLDVAEEDLSALGNVVVKTSWYALDQRLLVRGGVSVPTASTRLKEDELPIAALVASDELGFTMDSPVDGLCATVGVAVARQWGGTTLAAGAGYSVRAPFQPYDDAEEELNPGEELVLTAALYRRISVGATPALLKADAAVVLYGSDFWEDEKVRALGPRTDVRSVLALYPGSFDPVEVSVWVRLRARGMVSDGDKLVAEDENSFGPEGALRVRVGHSVAPWLKAETSGFVRFKGDNGYGFGGGHVFGLSVGPKIRLGRGTSLAFSAGVLGGSAWTGTGDTSLTGYEVRSTLVRAW